MFKRKGGGVKGLLNNVKKTALFSHDGFPNDNVNNNIDVSDNDTDDNMLDGANPSLAP